MQRRFDKCRILLVEDEAIIALAIEDMLAELGCTVIGPAYTVDFGRELAAIEQLDAAVLDINLAGESSGPIALTLEGRGVPFCFSSGYGSDAVPAGFEGRPLLQKPYTLDSLAIALHDLIG